MNKQQHEKWLAKRGLTRSQICDRKKKLGRPNSLPVLHTEENVPLSNVIPSNGLSKDDHEKARYARENYAMVPAYNKGPIQPVSKSDLQTGAGRKL